MMRIKFKVLRYAERSLIGKVRPLVCEACEVLEYAVFCGGRSSDPTKNLLPTHIPALIIFGGHNIHVINDCDTFPDLRSIDILSIPVR